MDDALFQSAEAREVEEVQMVESPEGEAIMSSSAPRPPPPPSPLHALPRWLRAVATRCGCLWCWWDCEGVWAGQDRRHESQQECLVAAGRREAAVGTAPGSSGVWLRENGELRHSRILWVGRFGSGF